MIEYENEVFYNDYFNNLPDFKLTSPFKLSKERDKNTGHEFELYEGTIEAVNCIHKPVISVRIPKEFPHKQLFFLTDTLLGYPHLIYNGDLKKSWFCLNSPFAETAEAQLDVEMDRLRGWLKQQLRDDLPAKIEDEKVKMALRKANAYAWENPDEMGEYSNEPWLTFVGDYYKDANNFKKRVGYLPCVRNDSNRLFALQNGLQDIKNTVGIPYVIVEEYPHHFDDFHSMVEQYGWDKKTVKHLLPDLDIEPGFSRCAHVENESIKNGQPSQSEDELVKEFEEAVANTTVPPAQKQAFDLAVQEAKHLLEDRAKSAQRKGKYYLISCGPLTHSEAQAVDYDEIDDDDELSDPYALEEKYENEFHIFALAVKSKGKLDWAVLYTCRYWGQYETYKYDFKSVWFTIEQLVGQTFFGELAQSIDYKHYFGRGAFCERLTGKKVAIIGLGSVGSTVAQALARGGVREFGLWDEDMIEPGNVCRSQYDIHDVGNSKVRALSRLLERVSPFCHVENHGWWVAKSGNWEGKCQYQDGSFYGSVNYLSQEESLKQLDGYDLIIDCTASNELLHFLSYAVKDKDVLSLCITNHASNLLCFSNRDGNPYELRKAYLSKIEQDTKNFYAEGTGCYSPTFLATGSDVAALANLAVRAINQDLENGGHLHSTIWSYSGRGVVADTIKVYQLPGSDIRLYVGSETLEDGQFLDDTAQSPIGFMLGSYDMQGKMIMVTHFIPASNAENSLQQAWDLSHGIIDYIGDFRYSTGDDECAQDDKEIIAAKAQAKDINTNNPLLAVRRTDGDIDFYLYFNGTLQKFETVSD